MAKQVPSGKGKTSPLKGPLITVYTDEDVPVAFADATRRRGFSASTTLEHKNLRLGDDEQIRYATSIGAALITHNVKDFPRHHYEFMDRNESHNGIIIAKQVQIGELVKRFLRMAAKLSTEDMKDRLEYLSNW